MLGPGDEASRAIRSCPRFDRADRGDGDGRPTASVPFDADRCEVGRCICQSAGLGVLLLLRRQDGLVLAPLYGAALLSLLELARTSLELRGLDHVERGAIRARLLTILLFASLGACAAGVAAIAVTAPPRVRSASRRPERLRS